MRGSQERRQRVSSVSCLGGGGGGGGGGGVSAARVPLRSCEYELLLFASSGDSPATHGLYGLVTRGGGGEGCFAGGARAGWRDARADELARRHCEREALAMPRVGRIIDVAFLVSLLRLSRVRTARVERCSSQQLGRKKGVKVVSGCGNGPTVRSRSGDRARNSSGWAVLERALHSSPYPTVAVVKTTTF